MNEKKDITISNSAFSLTIHWNGALFGTQMSILGMCLLMYFIANNEAVKQLCIGVLVIDILFLIVSLFFGKEKEEMKSKDTVVATPAETPPAKETAKTASKKTSTKTQDKVIKNKLQAATPKQPAVTASTPTAPTPAPVPTPASVQETLAPEQPVLNIETISADDISLDDFDFGDFDL